MKLNARKDVDMAAAELFAAISDFAYFERLALSQGVVVDRLAGEGRCAAGSVWRTRFLFRGRERTMTTRISEVETPRNLFLQGQSGNYDLFIAAHLAPLSRYETRLAVEFVVKPRSLAARMTIQTMRLARARIEARLSRKLGQFVDHVRTRARAGLRG